MISLWPFDQEPNVAAITSRQVLEGHPILRIAHYPSLTLERLDYRHSLQRPRT
jgi:hypothetical protein